jgi:hypothetical protein
MKFNQIFPNWMTGVITLIERGLVKMDKEVRID